MGLVMIWVAAPAAREAMKKSGGVRRGGRTWTSPLRWREWKKTRARSARDLKKKKEAQLVALPRMFGVRPR